MKKLFLRISINYYRAIINSDKSNCYGDPIDYYEGSYSKTYGPYVYCYSMDSDIDMEELERHIYENYESENVRVTVSKVSKYIDCLIAIQYLKENFNYRKSNDKINEFFSDIFGLEKSKKRVEILKLKDLTMKKFKINPLFVNYEVRESKIIKLFAKNRILSEQSIVKQNFILNSEGMGAAGGPGFVEYLINVGNFYYSWFIIVSTIYGIFELLKAVFNTKFDYYKRKDVTVNIPVFKNFIFSLLIILLSVLTIFTIFPVLKILQIRWQSKYIYVNNCPINLELDNAIFYKIFYKSLFLTIITLGIYFPFMYKNLKNYLYSCVDLHNSFLKYLTSRGGIG